jgi:hypothetical protein
MTMHITSGVGKDGPVRQLRLTIRDEHEATMKNLWGDNPRLEYSMCPITEDDRLRSIRRIRFTPKNGGLIGQLSTPPSGNHIYCSWAWAINRRLPWLPRVRETDALMVIEWNEAALELAYIVPDSAFPPVTIPNKTQPVVKQQPTPAMPGSLTFATRVKHARDALNELIAEGKKKDNWVTVDQDGVSGPVSISITTKL